MAVLIQLLGAILIVVGVGLAVGLAMALIVAGILAICAGTLYEISELGDPAAGGDE